MGIEREEETCSRNKRQNGPNLITFGLGIKRRMEFGIALRLLPFTSKLEKLRGLGLAGWKKTINLLFNVFNLGMCLILVFLTKSNYLREHPD